MANSAFNPSDWLAWFEAHGGGWIVQDGRPVLLCPAGAKDCDRWLAELEASGRQGAVLTHIVERHRTISPVPAE